MKTNSNTTITHFVKNVIDLIFFIGIISVLGLPYFLHLAFKLGMGKDENYVFLLIFLYITGILILFALQELRKIFNTLKLKNPFCMENVRSLKHISYFTFIISLAFLIKVIFFISLLTVAITVIFLIEGLFAMVLSEVFHQAVIVKSENDLTI